MSLSLSLSRSLSLRNSAAMQPLPQLSRGGGRVMYKCSVLCESYNDWNVESVKRGCFTFEDTIFGIESLPCNGCHTIHETDGSTSSSQTTIWQVPPPNLWKKRRQKATEKKAAMIEDWAISQKRARMFESRQKSC